MALAIVMAILVSVSLYVDWISTIFALVITCVALFPIVASRTLARDGFHPYSYLIFNDFSRLVMPAFVISGTLDDPALSEKLPEMALLLCLAFLFVWLGYTASLGKQLAHAIPLIFFSPRISTPPWRMALCLYFAGWLARLYLVSIGFSHLPNQELVGIQWLSIVRDFANFGTLSYVLLVYLILARHKNAPRKSTFWFVLITTLGEVAAGTLDGGRTAIVLPILYLVFVYSFVFKPLRWSTLLSFFLAALLILGPLLTMYRTALFERLLQGDQISLDTAVSALWSVDFDVPYALESMFVTVRHRTGMFEGDLRVLDRVPSRYDHMYGETFSTELLTGFVPRIVWPDKPVFMINRLFSSLFWDNPTDWHEVGTSDGIGMPAELYLNFGWFGVSFIFVLGIVLRVLTERLRLYQSHEFGMGIIRLHYVVFVMGSMSTTIGGYIIGGVRAWLVYLVFLSLVFLRLPKLRLRTQVSSRNTIAHE